ncbi:THAP domain-containing protein 5 isoform X3 [Dipodomys spectabilis]|uniref:THAP domain-containing protein 5 isoform X3 n=1 Tax=Dipodomys spectabilis TaxID=105255 RepID=UPI001C53DE70|nr:THAP domain-containing protein 5 isoform X3 [Dipodomys spectabilis]
MPRYCAAICCKNRRGRNNKGRKLSFYPFPLHDKERLEKWLKNMKRESWVPSKYQFLCSDHFTPDSLDIRWGIRYLKQTAIPTIFSLPEDYQGKESCKKKSQKKKLGDEKEMCLKAKPEESFASNEAKKNTVKIDILPEHTDLLDLPAILKPPAPKIATQNETIGMEDIDIEDSSYKNIDHSVDILQTEHSYCRQDINKEHLWQKVSKLHSKITLLELQEQQTLERWKSLEALISQLKQENWLSEENINIIENHFTTYEVTMI